MNEEEKKAIEKFIEKCNEYDESVEIKGVSVGEEYRILTTVCKALNLIEKLQKENEELKEDNMTYKRILDLADNRIYRKKYLEERRKEQPNLLYPDSDEIYQRYYELKQENEKLKTKLLNILEAQKVIKVETLSYIKENYIPIQKVKDKIEKLHKLLADIDYKDIEDKHEREFYKKNITK